MSLTALTKHEIADRVEGGAIHARILLEVLGKPVEHVNNTIQLLLTRLKEEDGVQVLNEGLNEAEEQESGMFSSFAEVEILADKLQNLIGICFYYMPSSIEIIDPASFDMPCSSVSDLFNDLLGKLHNVDMVAKNLRAENEHHKIVMGKLLRSSVMALLRNKKTAKDIGELLLIPSDQAVNILKHLKEEGLVKKVGKHYTHNR